MSLKSVNPFTLKEIHSFELDDKQRIEIKLSQSQDAFLSLKKLSFSERSMALIKVAEKLEDNAEDLALIMSHEMGKPISEGISEVKKCAWVCRYYAENGEGFLKAECIETDASKSFVQYDSIGSILAVMPWNFPFWQVFRVFAPNFILGNPILLKHASNVTACAIRIEEMILEALEFSGALITLRIKSDQVESLIKHPVVKATTLTGSDQAGRAVASASGANIKKTILELGGSNAFIVMADADLELAIEDAMIGRFLNSGQSCIAAKRILLHDSIHDEFLRQFEKRISALKLGNPELEETQVGPLARVDLAEELERQVQHSIELGAELRVGGQREDAMYSPTLLTNVKPGMPVFDEETFGPCACVTKFSNFEEAIQLVNLSQFGLGVSIYTQSTEDILARVDEFEDGAVFINSYVKSDPRLPFGGTKLSGFGRELGLEGIKAFANIKTVYVR